MLAQIRTLEEDYNKAIALFTGILNQFPELARVRLELARVYFLNENYDDARFHFELVKGGKDIPPDVIKNVDLFLDAIRRKKNWSFEVGFGLIPDSNVNQVSGEKEECIGTIFGPLCRELDSRKQDTGVRLSATGNHYWKLSKHFGIRTTAGAYITEYGGKEQDDYVFYAASGPRVIYKNGEASLQPTITKRLHSGHAFSEAVGLRLDTQNDFGRLVLAVGAAFNKNTYNKGYVHSVLKGTEYRAYIVPRFIVTNQCFVQAGIEYVRDETSLDIYGSDSWKHSLGGYYFFKYGFSLFLEGSLTKARYHAEQLYIRKDTYLDVIRRKDRIYELSAELGTNLWEGQGIRPSIRYSWTKRDSNMWVNDFERSRVDLLLTYRF